MSNYPNLTAAASPELAGADSLWSDELKRLKACLDGSPELQSGGPLWQQLQRTMLVGMMTSSFIHDLNNLLTVVEGSAVLAAGQLPAAHPAHENLEEISRAGRAAQAMSQRLGAFMRRQPLAPQQLDPGALLLEWSPLFKRLLGSTIRLKLEIAPQLWPVLADPVQVVQVLMNLLVNARDATPAGGTIALDGANMTMAVGGALPAGDYLCLTISDSGAGMEPEVLRRIFEPFFSTKRSGGGLGIGLATARFIVAELGGSIQVESAPGKGSTFRVYLPRAS